MSSPIDIPPRIPGILGSYMPFTSQRIRNSRSYESGSGHVSSPRTGYSHVDSLATFQPLDTPSYSAAGRPHPTPSPESDLPQDHGLYDDFRSWEGSYTSVKPTGREEISYRSMTPSPGGRSRGLHTPTPTSRRSFDEFSDCTIPSPGGRSCHQTPPPTLSTSGFELFWDTMTPSPGWRQDHQPPSQTQAIFDIFNHDILPSAEEGESFYSLPLLSSADRCLPQKPLGLDEHATGLPSYKSTPYSIDDGGTDASDFSVPAENETHKNSSIPNFLSLTPASASTTAMAFQDARRCSDFNEAILKCSSGSAPEATSALYLNVTSGSSFAPLPPTCTRNTEIITSMTVTASRAFSAEVFSTSPAADVIATAPGPSDSFVHHTAPATNPMAESCMEDFLNLDNVGMQESFSAPQKLADDFVQEKEKSGLSEESDFYEGNMPAQEFLDLGSSAAERCADAEVPSLDQDCLDNASEDNRSPQHQQDPQLYTQDLAIVSSFCTKELLKDAVVQRCKVQKKSLPDLDTSPRPPQAYKLTPEEEKRNARKRECNKISAQRSREKKKAEKAKYAKEVSQVAARNEDLQNKMKELTRLKNKAVQLFMATRGPGARHLLNTKLSAVRQVDDAEAPKKVQRLDTDGDDVF